MLWSRWLSRIEHKIDVVIQQGVNVMAEIDDFNTAMADLKTEVGALGTKMDAEFAALQAALAANNGPAITAATANIRGLISDMQAIEARDTLPAPVPATPAP